MPCTIVDGYERCAGLNPKGPVGSGSSEFPKEGTMVTSYDMPVTVDEYRRDMRVDSGALTNREEFPRIYNYSGDVTITTDPIRLDSYIYDGYHAGEMSNLRGKLFNASALENLLGKIENTNPQPSGQFQPTLKDFAPDKLFSPPIGSGCNNWRGYKRRTNLIGRLPVVSGMIYNGELYNKDRDQIAAEMREAERRTGARVFSPMQELPR